MDSAAQCCGPYDYELGRKGYSPPPAGCSVYDKANPYHLKCEPKNSTGTTKPEETDDESAAAIFGGGFDLSLVLFNVLVVGMVA